MFGISWFDLFFFVVVVLLEIHHYRKSNADDKAFAEFQTEVTDTLCEVSQRLDEAIETAEPEEDDLDEETYVETIQKS